MKKFVLILGLPLCSLAANAENTAAPSFRVVQLKMPQTAAEFYGQVVIDSGAAFGCERGEIVKTCDTNTNVNGAKKGFFGRSLVLGTAVSHAFLGLKITTKCTAVEVTDFGGIAGCAYQACVGYAKPVAMVCMKK